MDASPDAPGSGIPMPRGMAGRSGEWHPDASRHGRTLRGVASRCLEASATRSASIGARSLRPTGSTRLSCRRGFVVIRWLVVLPEHSGLEQGFGVLLSARLLGVGPHQSPRTRARCSRLTLFPFPRPQLTAFPYPRLPAHTVPVPAASAHTVPVPAVASHTLAQIPICRAPSATAAHQVRQLNPDPRSRSDPA